MKHGKKYSDSLKLIDRSKLYDANEAVELCVKTGTAKFDETVEVHVKLGVDSRHADQQVRGAVVLPNGTGKNVRVLAICKGDAAKEAEAAGLVTLKGHRLTGGMRASIYNAMPKAGCEALVNFMKEFELKNK